MEEQILLTAREIAEIMGTPKRTIQRRADKESWPFIGEHGNGGKTKKYFLHGLPMEIRHAHNIKGIATTIPGGEEQPPDTVPSAPSGGPAGHIVSCGSPMLRGARGPPSRNPENEQPTNPADGNLPSGTDEKTDESRPGPVRSGFSVYVFKWFWTKRVKS